MNTQENEQKASGSSGKSSNTPDQQNFQKDHPGMQEISKNQNPRANENLPDENTDIAKEKDATEQVGSEITDGEAG